MARGRRMKNPNGFGSVVKLSGNRRKPFEVRVNTRMDERYYPIYDVLGRYESRAAALIELAKYNDKPYDLASREITFKEVYEAFFNFKYEMSSKKQYSNSTKNCTRSAYNHSSVLYDKAYRDLRTNDFQEILATEKDGEKLSHSLQEHIKNLFNQMDKYALSNDIIEKAYSVFAAITVEEDDEPGVPFTSDEIKILWKNKDKPYVDTILIFCYSGWRISELLGMKTEDVDLKEMTFTGGVKTSAGKNRIVPIHSSIQSMVRNRLTETSSYFFSNEGVKMYTGYYTKTFKETLVRIGINTFHTPHDCRHTFTSLLDSAGANHVCIDRMIGHKSDSLTKNIYTHKEIAELREAIELIKTPSV